MCLYSGYPIIVDIIRIRNVAIGVILLCYFCMINYFIIVYAKNINVELEFFVRLLSVKNYMYSNSLCVRNITNISLYFYLLNCFTDIFKNLLLIFNYLVVFFFFFRISQFIIRIFYQ